MTAAFLARVYRYIESGYSPANIAQKVRADITEVNEAIAELGRQGRVTAKAPFRPTRKCLLSEVWR